MQDLQIWITYHDDSQIEDFGLADANGAQKIVPPQ